MQLFFHFHNTSYTITFMTYSGKSQHAVQILLRLLLDAAWLHYWVFIFSGNTLFSDSSSSSHTSNLGQGPKAFNQPLHLVSLQCSLLSRHRGLESPTPQAWRVVSSTQEQSFSLMILSRKFPAYDSDRYWEKNRALWCCAAGLRLGWVCLSSCPSERGRVYF